MFTKPSSSMRLLLSTLLFAATSLSAANYSLSDYFPIQEGETWYFSSEFNGTPDSDRPETITKTGPEKLEFFGFDYLLNSQGLGFIGDFEDDYGVVDSTPDVIYGLPVTLSDQTPYHYNGENTSSTYSTTNTNSYNGSVIVVGFEDVTVPFGTYRALKVVDTTVGIDTYTDTSFPGTYSIIRRWKDTTTIWLVEGVGPVKYDIVAESEGSQHASRTTYDRIQPTIWYGASGEEFGWKCTVWLSCFYSEGYGDGWIYHNRMGFLYALGESPFSVWFWDETFGWFWTGLGIYPYAYLFNYGTWMTYSGFTNGFYNHDTDLFLQM